MEKIFLYDNKLKQIKVNEESILLIKEIKTLWNKDKNKATKYLIYIYLMLDWCSPYYQYLEEDRHQDALIDSELTEKDLENPLFKDAYQKYDKIVNSSRYLSLLRTAKNTLYKMEIFLENVDLNERIESGAYLNKAKDVIESIASIGKMGETIEKLEKTYKEDVKTDITTRGDHEKGFADI